MSTELVDALVDVVDVRSRVAGVVLAAEYRPAGGDKVFPPSYPMASQDRDRPPSPYLFEKRWVEGFDKPRELVVLDQPPSQANRVEAALLEARDAGDIELPLFELVTDTSRGPLRLTSLEFPHRFADAYLRDSLLDGKRFDSSDVGRRLRSASSTDLRPLFEWSPESLVFGAWDSHRKGYGVKLPRLYTSSVVGLDPVEGKRRGGKADPFNLTGAVPDSSAEDWEFTAAGSMLRKKEGQKLSELGHGHILPGPVHGGVAITGARRTGWLSLAALRRLRFGNAPTEAVRLARATLLALTLAGDRLAFDTPSLWLRSGCDLVRTSETLAFDRGEEPREPVTVGAAEAIACFHELRDRTAEAGIVMARDTITLTPIKGLADAIEYSISRASIVEEE